MRQQEANQFDKGMNLDTNPIAMDNHTLTGALNATMITMNGNELVLQNDMGNAKVGQAQLPEGYVPVGMKEHGGIVYVASYNPLKGESQIGCFPSPQRNISSEDEDSVGVELGGLDSFISGEEVQEIQKKVLLIDDTLRAGDKFIIVSTDFGTDGSSTMSLNSAIGNNLVDLKVIVLDSEGNGIDITSGLREYTSDTYSNFNKILSTRNVSPLSDYYNIYKNKISGKLYIQEELILPSFITASVDAETVGDQIKVTFTPHAFNADGTDWNTNTIDHYKLVVKNKNHKVVPPETETFSYIVDSDEELTYEIYPVYNYHPSTGKTYAQINKLKRTGVINVASIGSGKVDFNGEFRYYNDWAKKQLMLDYSLQAYIENSSWILEELYIQAYDVEDLFDSDGNWVGGITDPDDQNYEQDNSKIEIQLPILNYFGSYSQSLSYKANTSSTRKYFDSAHYYIGRICAKTNNGSISSTYVGPWYAIITSTITNEDYLNSSDNMYPIERQFEEVDQSVVTVPDQTNYRYYTLSDGNYTRFYGSTWGSDETYYVDVAETKLFELSWKTEFSREDKGSNDGDLVTSGNETNLITKRPTSVDDLVSYITTKNGQLKYKYKGETSVYTHESFPYTVTFTPNLVINTPTYSRDVNYSGNETINSSNLIQSVVDPTNLTTTGPIKFSKNDEQKILTITYGIKSQFFSKLKQNPNAVGQTGLDAYKFQLETEGNAFVPYAPLYDSPDNQAVLEGLFGSFENFEKNGENKIINIYPHSWFAYCLETISWDETGNWIDSDSTRVSVWNRDANHYIGIYNGPVQLVGKPSDSPHYSPITYKSCTNKSSLENWANVSVGIGNKISSKPVMIFWYGIWSEPSGIASSETGNATHMYCIPMIKDASGEYYVMKQWGLGDDNKGLLLEFIKAFNTIYIEQPDQNIAFDYWTNSNDPNDYVYTLPYNVIFKTKVSTSSHNNIIGLELSGHFNTYNKLTSTLAGGKYHLPQFRLVDKSSDVSCEEYTDTIAAPNQNVMIAKLLDTSVPVLDKCAIIKDKNGSTVITNAYKFNSSTKSETSLRSDHTYLLCGYQYQDNNFSAITGSSDDSTTAILVDINASDSNGLAYAGTKALGKYGLKVAQAIIDGKLRKERDTNNNYNLLVINAGKCNKITNTAYRLGEKYHSSNEDTDIIVRKKITDIAENYVRDIELLNTSNGATSVSISNF